MSDIIKIDKQKLDSAIRKYMYENEIIDTKDFLNMLSIKGICHRQTYYNRRKKKKGHYRKLHNLADFLEDDSFITKKDQ